MRSLFTSTVDDSRANPLFLAVRDEVGYTACRALMDEVFGGYHDKDRNFVHDFQTTGFSARVWELSLFAFLNEAGLNLLTDHPTPDYIVDESTPVAIEAATSQPPGATPPSARPSGSRLAQVPEDLEEAQKEFVFQMGKVLRRKLQKEFEGGLHYWELPHVRGKPFVLAVQAFHHASSLFHSVTFLAEYLYGQRAIPTHDTAGNLQISTSPIEAHEWGGRSIPSGLFNDPSTRNVSAVLFSNGGTVAQFNRIGTQRGFGAPGVYVVRQGTCHDPDPNAHLPMMFGYVVGEPDAPEEDFAQSMHVLHNPNAIEPLPPGALPGATEHRLDAGTGLIETTHYGFSPFGSLTMVLTGPGAIRTLTRFRGNANSP